MSNLKLQERIKEKTLNTIFQSEEYKQLLKELTNDILNLSKEAENEATVVSNFELVLYNFINSILGMRLYPEKERKVETIRHVSKGRIDSKLGAMVIEYKHFSNLQTLSQKEKASDQLSDYLQGLKNENNSNYYGIITDGIKVKFVRLENDQLIYEPYVDLSYKEIDRIIKSIVLMQQKALTSQNLVNDFYSSPEDSIAIDLVHDLYKSLNQPTLKTTKLFEEWRELFRLAHDDKSKQQAIEDRRRSLSEIIGHKVTTNQDEYQILFSLQTSYAIIIKLLAFNVLSKIKFNTNLLDYDSLVEAQSSPLRSKIHEIEEGGIFRDLGMLNIFEGDFFSWYAEEEQWNEEIAHNIKKIFQTLNIYEDKSLFPEGNDIEDLFKELYMKLIPEKVRHSLGEFYTPNWLSDNVVSESLEFVNHKNEWTGLDPCAGSGTFVITMIRKVINETNHLNKEDQLKQVLTRVKGIDLNPLAVLTARINYFINISHLIEDTNNFEIPIYLGDASYAPEHIQVEDIECVSYSISTAQESLDLLLPKSLLNSESDFTNLINQLESHISDLNVEKAYLTLVKSVDEEELPSTIKESMFNLCKTLVDLEKQGWNGIWTRIIKNFLATIFIGKFDIVVGNPPWIDWKNLPEGYRERIKSLCISRDLFSGDKRTGGINLNICALISNVVAQRWLKENGTLSFLMPKNLVVQQSYEGFRNFILDDGKKMYFQKFTDWTKSGHPFKPVTEKFFTFYINSNYMDYTKGVPVQEYRKKKSHSLNQFANIENFSEIEHIFEVNSYLLGHTYKESTKFTSADNINQLKKFSKIAGTAQYIGREGIEFYPQELFLLQIDNKIRGPKEDDILYLENYQNNRSKYKVPKQTIPLEKKYLHPLIKGTNISRFNVSSSEYIVPFPYVKSNPKLPLDIENLKNNSPLLANYFKRNKSVLEHQTAYSNKLIGNDNAPYYALARVGKYSFAEHHVVFRDNTKWGASVVSTLQTDWDGEKSPLFQNHAVSICEREDGEFITNEEAHYICSILNAPIVQKYILNSSDSRSFKIRPPVKVPRFDSQNDNHIKLSELSKEGHEYYNNVEKMNEIDALIDEYYLKILS
ncbi:hypothetical protein B5C08_01955 [Staphylococcus delphini]|uniref:site-specific DNA-methyltransferase (adenine-specific) n=1 Tax=Staphylococcus delphini TaxID=53344 RepID=A0A2A4GZ35_9STAP|nr:N-6 DNA methylase [Staphylococcus delphini]PCF56823.1 hypothetical protein B5C08_01955 [Staphylococcus delphini]